MKLLLLITAPIAVALAATSAQAFDRTVHTTVVTHHVDKTSVHHGNGRWKRVCNTRWVHHHKVRTCRNVRSHW